MAAEAGAGDDAEGTSGHAVRATVADVRLDVDVLELVMDDGARRASLLAGGRDAVLADVAHHEPAAWRGLVVRQHLKGALLAGWRRSGCPISRELLDELHVPPGRGRQLFGVIVAVARP